MKNLVIAANGLVGKAIVCALQQKNISFKPYCHKNNLVGMDILNILNFEQVKLELEKQLPQYVFLCANKAGGVNACEQDPRAATEFHVEATANLAKVCNKIGAKFIFISTDYIFSDRETPYDENEEASPLNIYGELKLQAERTVVDSCSDYLIIRTTNVYGDDPESKTPNYFTSTLNKLKQNQKIQAASCLFGNPTYVNDLARAIVELSEKDEKGIFHVVGPANMNRYEWTKKICEVWGYDISLIEEVKTLNDKTRRPQRIELDTKKLNNIIDWKFLDVREALQKIKKQ